MHHFYNRCAFFAVSAGTGDFVVGNVKQNCATPAQRNIPDGTLVSYSATDPTNSSQYETGDGIYSVATTTLTRQDVFENSNGDTSKIDFAQPPLVFIDQLAQNMEIELDADTTFYISTTGNDTTGNGSVGNPWATPQHAYDVVVGYELNGHTATIQIADGSYVGLVMGVPNLTGTIKFDGNSSDETAVTITPNGNDIFSIHANLNIQIADLSVVGTGAEIGVWISTNVQDTKNTSVQLLGTLRFTNLNCAFRIENGAFLYFASTAIHFTGNMTNVILNYESIILADGTFDVIGTPTWSDAFISINDQGLFHVKHGIVITGTATGKKFFVADGGVIQTGTNDLTLFPGNVAGKIDPGGQYDDFAVVPFDITVGALTTGQRGMMATVSDGDAGLAFGATVINTGAGATKYLVWYNGANWTVMGK